MKTFELTYEELELIEETLLSSHDKSKFDLSIKVSDQLDMYESKTGTKSVEYTDDEYDELVRILYYEDMRISDNERLHSVIVKLCTDKDGMVPVCMKINPKRFND